MRFVSQWLTLLGVVLGAEPLCTQERPPENPTTALLAEAATKADAKEWLDAIEQYQKILDTAGNEIVTVDGVHYLPARWVVHARLAALPADVLPLYRQRVEPQAAKRVAEALKSPRDDALQHVLAEMFCCAACEDAIQELARRAFLRGDFDHAEHYWQLLLPPRHERLRFPTPKTPVPAIQARLIMLQLYRHERDAAQRAFDTFQKEHPQASGLLAGKTGKYVDTLAELFAKPELTTLQPLPPQRDLETFAGGPSRTGTLRAALPFFWPDQPTWKKALPFPANNVPVDLPLNTQHPRSLAFHPLIVNGYVLLADGAKCYFLDARTGKMITHTEPKGGAATTVPTLQPVRHTLTHADGITYMRVGSAELRTGDGVKPSTLAALGPAPAGDVDRPVLWQLEPPRTADSTTHFEGAPTIVGQSIYVGFWRQSGIDAVAGVACYQRQDDAKPELRWQRVVGRAGAEPHGDVRVRHDLLTVTDAHVLTCTHAGSVVALDRRTGALAWEYRYPRVEQPIMPRYRDLVPVLVEGTRAYVAPHDADRLLCLDLLTGRLVWEREGVEVIHLLGVAKERVIASVGGIVKGLRGFNTRTGADSGAGGWTIHDEGGLATYGRGLVADEVVFWPTKHGLHFINPADGTPLRQRLPGLFGNLAYADGFLIVTTPTEVWGYLAEAKQVGQRDNRRAADPDNVDLQAAYAKACLDAGDFPAVLQTLPKTGPHEAELRWWLAERLVRVGERATAQTHYQKLADGQSLYAAAAAVRLAQLSTKDAQSQAWRTAWSKTGTVQDEHGIPVPVKRYVERMYPSSAPMRGSGLRDEEPITQRTGFLERQREIPLDDPTLSVLEASTRGIVAQGRQLQAFPMNVAVAIPWTATHAWLTANDHLLVMGATQLEWWTAEREPRLVQRLDLRGDVPRLARWTQSPLVLASGHEPTHRITHCSPGSRWDEADFVCDETRRVRFVDGSYTVHEPPAPPSSFHLKYGLEKGSARHTFAHPESLAGTRARLREVSPTAALTIVERNHGTEVDMLHTKTLQRTWSREPLFLGRHVGDVWTTATQFVAIVDGEVRAYACKDGAERWRFPLPDTAHTTWQLVPTPAGLLVHPADALMREPHYDAVAAIRKAGLNLAQLMQVACKSYDVWTERDFPVLVLDTTDGQLTQRLNFTALGPAAGVAWVRDELVVVTGKACWTLRPR